MSSKPKPREAELNFEGAMDRLEKIVEQMESGKLPLEDLIVRYEEGMNLVKVCQERLANAEQKIEIIARNSAGKPEVKEFEPAPEPEKRGVPEQSETGGHLGPNLGVTELTIALHRVFDTPRDRFVMDVSHQGYVHKMFTGRLDRFHTMRQFGGLNGFLLRTESEHDCYGAGHAGTALSAGLGMAVGRDLKGGNENIVVVAGDAAFTCGISYEALNNVKAHTKRFIVVLNDNEWSIAKNVGAIANYLNTIVASPTFAHLHEKARNFVQAIAGKSVADFAHKVEESVKGLLVPSVIFEELGLRYYGPIDGHDIPLLIRTFEFLKTQEEPVLLHI